MDISTMIRRGSMPPVALFMNCQHRSISEIVSLASHPRSGGAWTRRCSDTVSPILDCPAAEREMQRIVRVIRREMPIGDLPISELVNNDNLTAGILATTPRITNPFTCDTAQYLMSL